ncbi:DUF3429 domain-containing protein [Aestuariivirga sp.]|uniref:DUF3429 domain-containing protein n=1 Tax=Aestuariivirga sp. TaxID=2650926 RepID=UPI0025C4FBD9|nr:DUF3429 domain-containing protein [Aestuariivirga sp.]MCA3554667.1 DUF3429 domain-containing protein [Aestuariivirga sp.]
MSDRTISGNIPGAALIPGLAGLIPFVGGAAAQWVSLPMLPAETGLKLAIVYGAIILSFLGGIRWGTATALQHQGRQRLEFPASVLGPLAGLAAVFLPAIPALALLIAGFLMQGLWDVMSVGSGRLPAWFGRLRIILTAGAVVSLIATLLAVTVT